MSVGHDLTIMTNDKLLSQTISYLRFPLTVGVVFIHFNLAKSPFSMHGVKYGLDNPDWYSNLIRFLSEVLPSIAVPLFFLISGFLFFYKTEFDQTSYKRKLHTRARTLLVPFVLWNIIALLTKAVRMIPALSPIFPNAYKTEVHFSLGHILNTFYDGRSGILITPVEDLMTEVNNNPFPTNVPMWYVRDLIIMVLLAPVIYWMIKKAGAWFVVAMGIVWYFMKPIFFPTGAYPVLLSTALFFFSWGAYFSINRQNFVEILRKFKFAPLVYLPIAVADMLTKKTGYTLYIHQLGILVGIVSAVVIVSYLLEQEKIKVNSTLANASFFVFALHTLVMYDIGKVIFTALHLPDTTSAMLMLYFAVPTITILLCLGLYLLLKKYIPSVCNLLTGGR